MNMNQTLNGVQSTTGAHMAHAPLGGGGVDALTNGITQLTLGGQPNGPAVAAQVPALTLPPFFLQMG